MLYDALSLVLLVLGFGFLIANVRFTAELVRYARMRPSAVLTWPGRRPPFYGLLLTLGVVLGGLVLFKLVIQDRPPRDVFGEGMMFVYYGYAVPLSRRIGRGFYRDGIWSESGFVPYWKIDGLRWKEGEEVTLVLIDRVRKMARLLVVPQPLYGAARRILRDRLASHDIHFAGKAFDLGEHDERDDV
ncbi:MAG TPA: hypothetical protein VMN81_11310 [Vicinamibacterales bacterium]|nr:hypothetical protein [Vicinamibacterales bacterium]